MSRARPLFCACTRLPCGGCSDSQCPWLVIAGFGVVYMQAVVGQWFFAQLLDCCDVHGRGRAAGGTPFAYVWLVTWPARVSRRCCTPGSGFIPHMASLVVFAPRPSPWLSLDPGGAVTRAVLGAAMLREARADGTHCSRPRRHGARCGSHTRRRPSGLPAARGRCRPRCWGSSLVGYSPAAAGPHGMGVIVTSVLLISPSSNRSEAPWLASPRRGLPCWRSPSSAHSTIFVYLREGGPSYRPWKWITFFLPLFVASVLAVVVGFVDLLDLARGAAARTWGRRRLSHPRRRQHRQPTSIGPTATNVSSLTLDQINAVEHRRSMELRSPHRPARAGHHVGLVLPT